MPEGCDTVVFHRAALGDFVLAWPLLRALVAAGRRVAFVTDGAKARLAQRELGVRAVEIEQRRFSSLWVAGHRPEAVRGVQRLVSFLADPAAASGRTWIDNARAMFPGAQVEAIGGPLDRPLALQLAGAAWERAGGSGPAPTGPETRPSASGPVVAHVGAGSRGKMWPLDRWAALATCLQAEGRPVRLIAGEAEAERFTPEERSLFERLGGRFILELETLADLLKGTRRFVAADCGPAHLAAQLGAPTVVLFGPTDPARWAPIGPDVRVIAPERPSGMAWLGVETVAAALR